MNVKVEERLITPDEARALLELNVCNRKVSQSDVNYFVGLIKAGHFYVSNDAICISASNQLLNGQHRLWACVEADLPIRALLGTGYADNAVGIMDSGRKRTAANHLGMLGVPYAAKMGALVRQLFVYARHDTGCKIPNIEVENFVNGHKDALLEAIQAMRIPKHLKEIPMKQLEALYFIAVNFLNAKDEIERFINVFRTLTPTHEGCPAHMAYKTFNKHNRSTKGRRMPEVDLINVILKAWNDFRNGVDRKIPYGPANMAMCWDIKGFDPRMLEDSVPRLIKADELERVAA